MNYNSESTTHTHTHTHTHTLSLSHSHTHQNKINMKKFNYTSLPILSKSLTEKNTACGLNYVFIIIISVTQLYSILH